MANSDFVVINAVHNDHGKILFFPVFLCFNHSTDCGCYIHCGKHKSHRWPKQCKLSFSVMLNGECTKLNQSFNSLTEPDSF